MWFEKLKADDTYVAGVYACLWESCEFESADSNEIVRHVNFHSYHTKIKSIGSNILARLKLPVSHCHSACAYLCFCLTNGFVKLAILFRFWRSLWRHDLHPGTDWCLGIEPWTLRIIVKSQGSHYENVCSWILLVPFFELSFVNVYQKYMMFHKFVTLYVAVSQIT